MSIWGIKPSFYQSLSFPKLAIYRASVVKSAQIYFSVMRGFYVENMSILNLILNASLVVQLVMVLLLIFSVVSWSVIFYKAAQLKSINKVIDGFVTHFNMPSGFNNAIGLVNKLKKRSGVTQVFYDGVIEYNKSVKAGLSDKSIILQNVERAIQSSIAKEISAISNKLDLLATFGSVSPYIGLFGTVWGIMHSFIGLGSSNNQATLSSVAPGIAEALVATAIGLFVAIPAYIFYNKYTASLEKIQNKLYCFGDDFLNSVNRNLYGNKEQSVDNFQSNNNES